MNSTDPNLRPCYLNGCAWVLSTDGSQECTVCGLYRGPDLGMVNALLRANAGGREYRRQAAALNLAILGQAPKAPAPVPPPVYKGADGSHELPGNYVVLPIAAFIGIAIGLLAWRLIGGALL